MGTLVHRRRSRVNQNIFAAPSGQADSRRGVTRGDELPALLLPIGRAAARSVTSAFRKVELAVDAPVMKRPWQIKNGRRLGGKC